jgi:hypothetical protein
MGTKDLIVFISVIIFMHIKLISQTVESSKSINKNDLQFEFETLYSKENEYQKETTSWNVPNILVRYGLSENIEIQLHTPFTKERCFENNELTTNIFKFQEIEIGASINLWSQNKLIPEAALLVRVISPTDEFSYKRFGNIVSLNFSNTVSNTISFNYNIGTVTDNEKNKTVFYILNICYEPNSKIHCFIENTNSFAFDKTASNCLGTGLGVNFGSNFTVDFSVAKSLKHQLFYSGAIITWVINTKKAIKNVY